LNLVARQTIRVAPAAWKPNDAVTKSIVQKVGDVVAACA
jgi:hypothetical protein